MPPKPTFFPTPSDFRAWLEAHHNKFPELLVGFYKKSSGKPGITWPESVAEALCFGWIDGVRKSLNETSYTIRFTPRKPTSNWSSININLVRKLTKQGLMHPAGLKAFAARSAKKIRHLLLRTTEERSVHARTRKAVSRQQSRLGFFPFSSSLVPEGDNVLGHQRKEGRHEAQAAFRPDRAFAASPNPAAEYTHEEELTWPLAM